MSKNIGGSRIIKIDRSKPFDLTKFLGAGRTIWKGPANGDGLTGKEDQDSRSLAITELDLSKIQFRDMLKSSETCVNGEEKQRRLVKAQYACLDIKVFLRLWEKKVLIPSYWKELLGGKTRFIYFDGTKLRSPCGHRCVLCLYYAGGRWRRCYDYLSDDFGADGPSAVLDFCH
jgi:hypothetical protein